MKSIFIKLLENEMDNLAGDEAPLEAPPEAPPAPPAAPVDDASMAVGDITLAKGLALRVPGISSADRVALSVEISSSNIDSIREKLHEILNIYDTP